MMISYLYLFFIRCFTDKVGFECTSCSRVFKTLNDKFHQLALDLPYVYLFIYN